MENLQILAEDEEGTSLRVTDTEEGMEKCDEGDPRTCIKCWEDKVDLIFPCLHFISFKRQNQSEIENSQNFSGTFDVTCPSCRLTAAKPCKHEDKSAFCCPHCHQAVCQKCIPLHKEIIRSEIDHFIKELKDALQLSRDVEAGLVDKNLNKLSCHLKAEIGKIISSLRLNLKTTHDELMLQRRSQLDKLVAEVKGKHGDFEVFDFMIHNLVDPIAFASMSFFKVVTCFERLKKKVSDLCSLHGHNFKPTDLLLQLPSETDLKGVENHAENLFRELCCVETTAICTPNFNQSYSVNQTSNQFSVSRVATQLDGLPSTFQRPVKIAFFKELSEDRFVVVHNSNIISTIEISSFRVIEQIKVKLGGRRLGDDFLSSDIAYFDGLFYVSHKSRQKIFVLNAAFVATFFDSNLNLNGDKMYGLEVSVASKEIFSCTRSNVISISLTNSSRTRVISPPWIGLRPYCYYLKGIVQDRFIFSQFDKVFACNFVVSNGTVILNDTLTRIAQSWKYGNVRGCTVDPANGNLVLSESGVDCLQFFRTDGTLLSPFTPDKNLVPDFGGADVALVPCDSGLVILTCEYDKHRLTSISLKNPPADSA